VLVGDTSLRAPSVYKVELRRASNSEHMTHIGLIIGRLGDLDL